MIDFDRIKLIIWDLDETYWKGTLSEETVSLSEENIQLIKDLTDAGIVNSICSKNDDDAVYEVLKDFEIDNYFVFKSVNWEAKGYRIKQIIENMQLRGANVLFIDDNHLNLEEAKFYVSDIMIAGPEIITDLVFWIANKEKRDIDHKRLNQYKILETKVASKSKFSSNEEFLLSSNIKVEIHNDCVKNANRIHELLMRANQLNFTKKRDSLHELEIILKNNSYECGYVTVKDNFGDYGLVGFYSLKDNVLVHFLFSCRTLGMGIEQYVYNYLGRPELEIVGDVVSDLSSDELPKWINQNVESRKKDSFAINSLEEHVVLMKGPCDLFQLFPFISKSEYIDTEFTYVKKNGATIESTGHTTHIVESYRLSQEQKKRVVDELPFMDLGAYKDNIFKYPYKVVVLSLLADCNLGVYRRKETGEEFAFIEYTSDMTNPDNYDKLINKKCNVGGFDFTKEFLDEFSSKYEFLGRNTPEKILSNIDYIRSKLDLNCALVLMLGTETAYDMGDNPAYIDRHLYHKELNNLIKKWAETKNNVELVDVNKYITGPESFYDHINHFVKPIYYNLAKDIVDIINKHTEIKVSKSAKWKVWYMKLHDFAGITLGKIKRKMRG